MGCGSGYNQTIWLLTYFVSMYNNELNNVGLKYIRNLGFLDSANMLTLIGIELIIKRPSAKTRETQRVNRRDVED